MLRLPCLATRTPAPAATNAVAVEMLKVPLVSPPVPQVSTSASRSGAAGIEHGICMQFERGGRGPDRLGEADNLLHRLALHMERHQQRRNLRIAYTLRLSTSDITARASSRESDWRWLARMQDLGDHRFRNSILSPSFSATPTEGGEQAIPHMRCDRCSFAPNPIPPSIES